MSTSDDADSMMADMRAVAEGAQRMHDLLKTKKFVGAAGGGMVRVVLDGYSNLVRVDIEPSLMKPEEAGVLEDLVAAAHREARARVDAATHNALLDLSSKAEGTGMPLPADAFFPKV